MRPFHRGACAEGAALSRRSFIRSSLGLSGLVALSAGVPRFLVRAAAAAEKAGPSSDRVLVVIQLAGGNDGVNTVIPFGHDAYYRTRPSICVGADRVVRLGSDEIGLHPALAPMKSVFDAGRLAVVQGVGYPNPDRSHFRSMEIWETADPENRFRRTGWLGRALPRTATGDALQLGSREPALALAAEGRSATSLVSLESLAAKAGPGGGDPVREALAEALAAGGGAGSSDLEFLRESGRRALDTEARLARALESRAKAGDAGYPDFALASLLRDVAAVIASGFPASIYYVSLGGFDTHARQAPQHELLLSELAQSLAAFLRDVESKGQGERVLAITFSEFGRRLEENKSGGTDHGAAAPLFIASAGSALRGGIVGAHPSLDDLDDGDLKHHTDFRRVYATVLGRWLGLESAPILGAAHEPLPFV